MIENNPLSDKVFIIIEYFIINVSSTKLYVCTEHINIYIV